MFDAVSSVTNDLLMQQLRLFAQSTSLRAPDAIMAEMWRRGITKQHYLDWLKQQMEKENSES